jgi:predicted RNA-binding Zn ribbon-like protein
VVNLTRVDFLWVGNHPGVDLCNTIPVVDGDPRELLATTSDLRRWLSAVDPALARHLPDQPTLRWVRDLREALRAVLVAERSRRAPLRRLNESLEELSAVPEVDLDGNLRLGSPKEQEQIRLAVASLAAGACALPPDRVRRCANPKCVLLFFDSSKNGSRRWHDMATCGNRAKAAAHHERVRNTTTG